MNIQPNFLDSIEWPSCQLMTSQSKGRWPNCPLNVAELSPVTSFCHVNKIVSHKRHKKLEIISFKAVYLKLYISYWIIFMKPSKFIHCTPHFNSFDFSSSNPIAWKIYFELNSFRPYFIWTLFHSKLITFCTIISNNISKLFHFELISFRTCNILNLLNYLISNFFQS